jgi:hypothetical protein
MRFNCHFLNPDTDEQKTILALLSDAECKSVESLRKHKGTETADLHAQDTLMPKCPAAFCIPNRRHRCTFPENHSSITRYERRTFIMSTVQSENRTHQTTCNLSEATRQADVAAAMKAFNLGGTQAAFNAAMAAADAAHFRRVIASCVANSVDGGVFRQGLHDLIGQWV